MPQHSSQRPAHPGGAADRDECSRAACRGCGSGAVPGAGPDRRPGRQRAGSRGRRRALGPAGPCRRTGRRSAAGPRRYSIGPVVFGRFEPVPPPAIIQRNPERQSAHRLVSAAATPTIPLVEVTSDECQLFAPKATVELAEWHGRFDDAIGSGDAAQVRASFEVAARESGILPEQGADEMPYLPDPLAIGVAIAGGPGMPPATPPAIEWPSTTWHDPAPITLRLPVNDLHFQPPPDIDTGSARSRSSWTPRAATASASPRCCRPDQAGRAAPGAGTGGEGGGALVDEQHLNGKRAVTTAGTCMFTPWQEVELVHAVQRPREAPDLQKESEIIRHAGQTEFKPNCTLMPEPFSTSTLTLAAGWTDFVDDPAVRCRPPVEGQPLPWTRQVGLRGRQHHVRRSRTGRRREARFRVPSSTSRARRCRRWSSATPSTGGELHRDRASRFAG